MPNDPSLLIRRSPTERFGDRSATGVFANPLLAQWLASSYVLTEDWERLTAEVQTELVQCTAARELLKNLVQYELLNEYQADRMEAGRTFGLTLGNFRVLGRLGAGAMGVVFLAEHVVMRRLAAIKVISFAGEEDAHMLLRFRAEMRAVAQLQHPNIVSAFDAGSLTGPDPDRQTIHYFVMEYVQGRDLEEMVARDGVLQPAQACDLAYQIATALAEAQKFNLVHRDLKPANILVTAGWQAKLLDFGLARHFGRRMTEPGTILGTIDYMAPEQVSDARTVDIRADIYGLGGTVYWCLTGRPPFPQRPTIKEDLVARLTQEPPSVRDVRPDISEALEQLLARMMALDPGERFQTPNALCHALLPFLHANGPASVAAAASPAVPSATGHRVLVTDDEADIRNVAVQVLKAEGMWCDEAATGAAALAALEESHYDLVLLDLTMPGLSGLEVLARLRQLPSASGVKVIMMSGRASSDDMAETLTAGADDCLSKPFSLVQLRSRVHAALRLKDAQDHSAQLNGQLTALAAAQEQALQARDSDLFHARNALVLALAKLAKQRDAEQSFHLQRLQRYCRCLAEAAAERKAFAGLIDENFVQMLESCSPLHDIGNVALPEHILLKPGKLTVEERLIMQTHTTIGADTLADVAQQHPFAGAFLKMAVDIVRHHHERWDGAGYPDRLAGSAIPLAARIVAIADAYDALRCRRAHRPALSHATATRLLLDCAGQFDPDLIAIFQQNNQELEKIFQQSPN